jgi:hypothetical protein
MIVTPARMSLALPRRERETELEQWTRKEIAAAGGWLVKLVAPGMKGWPDDICLWHTPGRRRGYRKALHFLEFKLVDTEPDDNQVLVHAALRRMGHDVLIPRDRAWVRQYIETYRSRSP